MRAAPPTRLGLLAGLALVGLGPLLPLLPLGAGCLSKPGFDCTLAATSTDPSANLGTMGGNPGALSRCDNRPVVGLEVTMSRDLNGAFNEKTTIRVALRCATLTNHDGDYTASPPEALPAVGGSLTGVEGPFIADCPAGQVVVGLAAHIVGDGGLLNSFLLDCAPLDPAGAPTGAVTQRPVVGTGTMPAGTDARCDPGRALVGIRPYSGNELDRMTLVCSQTTCD